MIRLADAVSDLRLTASHSTYGVSKDGMYLLRTGIRHANPGSGIRPLDNPVGGMVVWDSAQSQPLRRFEIELT